MPLIIDRFGRKRCQKKRKDIDYQFLLEVFQKYFVVHEHSTVKKTPSVHTKKNPVKRQIHVNFQVHKDNFRI